MASITMELNDPAAQSQLKFEAPPPPPEPPMEISEREAAA